MKILITGAGGFVGHKIAEHFRRSHSIEALSRSELDITSPLAVGATSERLRPDLIMNCAVLGVDACEEDPAKAHAVNIEGPANLARVAERQGAAIVHFSTNYVFDGERNEGSYTADDEAKPINVYGRTKLEGERAVAAECARSFIVRTSWVFGGSKAGFFDRAIVALERYEPIEAVTDNWASVTLIDDLVERLDDIILAGRYGIYHAANSGVCSKYEFAVEAARLMSRDPDELVIPVKAAASLTTKRPRYTPMECRLSEEIGLAKMRNWRTAVASRLREILH